MFNESLEEIISSCNFSPVLIPVYFILALLETALAKSRSLYEGILGTVAGIIGNIQANEVLKKILNIGKNLNGYILILDLLNLNFRKVKLNKIKNV